MTRRLSASRLNHFLGCQHRTWLWLTGVAPPETEDSALELVRAKGFEHEATVLARLQARYGAAVRIPDAVPLPERVRATAEAMAAGAPLIYQAAFANERWVGYPDYLVRMEDGTSERPRYEPEDAKLAKAAKAEHLLQLNIYAHLIEQATGAPVESGTIHVGGGADPERFDLRQTRHITARLVAQFEQFTVQTAHDTRAVRTAACAQCDYKLRCEAEWRAADSPVFVAGIRGDQIVRLERAGIQTLTALAARDPEQPTPDLGAGTFFKLVRQAKLQTAAKAAGKGLVEVLPIEPGRGFALLPPPQPGDLFFDIEGDPLYPEGLEYLLGLYGPLSPDGANSFLPIWAHDHPAEKLAFEQLMTLFRDHFVRWPTARVYHYAPYETVALKRLAMRYATMEAELDQMLRDQRFVDLYKVARQAIRASTESYSLKDLEKIYWGSREGEVTNAGDSIVQYERWRELGDAGILDAICRYNENDVVSTARLRDWLEDLRPAGAGYGLSEIDPEVDGSAPDDRALARGAFEQKRRELAAGVRASMVGDAAVRDLLAELLWFHQRAQKPVWWEIFDRQTWTNDELTEDPESLGGLRLESQVQDKRSYVATYRCPPQDTRLKVGSAPKIAATLEPAGAIVALDAEQGVAVLRRGVAKGDFPDSCCLSPGAPIDQKNLVQGLTRLLERLTSDPTSDQALIDLLLRRPPRLLDRAAGEPVICPGEDLLSRTIAAVRALDRSTLIIQGPPGTGKTFTTARAIVALLRDGKRVGVSSNSHKAINNVLSAVERHAKEIGFVFEGAKKGSRGDAETGFDGDFITTVNNSDEVQDQHRLVGGTAFHFAVEEPGAYDVLFVDEAGQVALGNLAAMSGCARNLVLVGDQMQLPQPVQGIHPGETGLSCLDYALCEHATVPANRGVLLNVSYRMHPAVCGFISEAVYDGRLIAHPSTRQRELRVSGSVSPALKPFGLSVVELEHEGRTQSCPEEAAAVAELIRDLVGQDFVETGDVRHLRLEDILVVTPFNLQVALLRQRLPQGARVGTVDKFQGQEAPVVIISMATSYGGDAPRGTEFLFNRNRLNVAISRAKCLAIIVRSRRLLDVPSASRDDLPRLDFLARFDTAAT